MSKKRLSLVIISFILISFSDCKKDKNNNQDSPQYYYRLTNDGFGKTKSYTYSLFDIYTLTQDWDQLNALDNNNQLMFAIDIPYSLFKGIGTYKIWDTQTSWDFISSHYSYSADGINYTHFNCTHDNDAGTVTVTEYKAGDYIKGNFNTKMTSSYGTSPPPVIINVTGEFYAKARIFQQ